MESSNIDLDKIEDIDKLKAYAFDEIQKRDLAESNLRAIAVRMKQLSPDPSKTVEEDKTESV